LLGARVGLGLGLGLGDRLAVGLGLGDRLAVGVGLGDRLTVGLTLGDRVPVGFAEVGATPPVHVVPLSVKLVGTGLLDVHEALNPNAALAFVANAPL
jgi:hypothetical protein